MNDRLVSSQLVQGQALVNPSATGTSYPPVISQWWYDVRVPCPQCSYYQANLQVGWTSPTLELRVVEQAHFSSLTFLLIDRATNVVACQHPHSCTVARQSEGSLIRIDGSVYELDLVNWLRRVETSLNTRLGAEAEFDKLRGTVKILQQRLEITEDELAKTKARNCQLAMIIREVHRQLDCPCEMDELDDLDLAAHLDQMGVLDG